MFTSRPTFRLLILVIVLACAGLVFLQVRLLLNTAELRRSSFDQNVMAALARTASGLEEMDVVDRIFITPDSLAWDPAVQGRRAARTGQAAAESTFQVSVMRTPAGTLRSWVRNGQLVTFADRPQRVTVRVLDVLGRVDTTLVDRKDLTGEQTLPLPRGGARRGTYFIQLRTDEAVSTMRFDSAGRSGGYTFFTGDSDKREKMVRKVVESFDYPMPMARRSRISSAVLDSMLGTALRGQSVDLPFEGALLAGDTSAATKGSAAMNLSADEAYRLPMAPTGLFALPETLAVRFPSRTAFVLTTMWPEIALSALLLGVIIWMFAATLRTIIKQKEFAGRLTDFINNMTHEFKTPLSTIALASEALQRSDIRRSGRKLEVYNSVIRDENKRMGAQVERILQMASLEEGELELRRDVVPIHAVIAEAVKNVQVQLAPRNGTITMQLTAQDDKVLGDRIHLENVVHNLLDNAVKYSTQAPSLTVSTENEGGGIRMTVSDRGIGIVHDQIARVFEKYYRVPTGNVHNVKGFGLGLSYVKLVVTSLGGTVGLTSRPGEGTDVTVRLPLDPHGRPA